ncbi:MAG: ATP-binding cassette domain-containing protein [Candidatus Riflebacteria bacterium]|nr:ATP-binding cassette domain-containing protein [Candidatus Riflebacteria bacterium]
MIEVKGVSFNYPEGPRVLSDIQLAIPTGDYVGIVGPNGSGKSTLVRLFNGLLLPQSGTVLVDGLDVLNRRDRPAIRQKVGLVFQNPENQIVGTIVEDDVAFGPENLGLSTPVIRQRVDEALARVGLGDLKDRSPSTLSGGQKQRLAIGSVLAMLPYHLVLDEPLSMLDPTGREEVLSVVARLNRDPGITVVYVTHALEELLQSNRVVALSEGKVIFDGPTARFLGEGDLHRKLDLEVPPLLKIASGLKKANLLKGELPRDLASLVEALCS